MRLWCHIMNMYRIMFHFIYSFAHSERKLKAKPAVESLDLGSRPGVGVDATAEFWCFALGTQTVWLFCSCPSSPSLFVRAVPAIAIVDLIMLLEILSAIMLSFSSLSSSESVSTFVLFCCARSRSARRFSSASLCAFSWAWSLAMISFRFLLSLSVLSLTLGKTCLIFRVVGWKWCSQYACRKDWVLVMSSFGGSRMSLEHGSSCSCDNEGRLSSKMLYELLLRCLFVLLSLFRLHPSRFKYCILEW